MFSLSIALKDNPAVWMLLFKTKETADKAYTKLVPEVNTLLHGQPGQRPVGLLEDDFGQHVIVTEFSGAIMEDMEQSKLAHIERALHMARTKAKADQIASSDPALRTAAMTQSPAVFSPLNGGYPRQ